MYSILKFVVDGIDHTKHFISRSSVVIKCKKNSSKIFRCINNMQSGELLNANNNLFKLLKENHILAQLSLLIFIFSLDWFYWYCENGNCDSDCHSKDICAIYFGKPLKSRTQSQEINSSTQLPIRFIYIFCDEKTITSTICYHNVITAYSFLLH